MSRAQPNPRNASEVITIESEDVEEDDVGTLTLFVFENPDSRIVVDGGGGTWEFVINEAIAYSRWEHHELPEWIEPILSRVGVRAVRGGQEDA
ncbi:hypothetical protein [Halobellus sp. GM3]|uniref:hypothetical protein n=1 Tax=Halobellus sp. GM3 TaxID=3458410 RepID=UPI00403DF3FC